LTPCPLPISISPSPLLPTCFFLFLHHSTPMYIHQQHFYTHPASLFCFILTLSPYPPFRFFGIFYSCSPATSTIPHPYILNSIVFPCLLIPAWPIPSPCPYLPPYPYFAFLILFMAIPMLPAPSPTLIYSLALFPMSPYPCLAHWIPPTTYLPPHPPFRFFGPFIDAFWCTFISYSIYMCTYIIYNIE
jgi:hypothetical protein